MGNVEKRGNNKYRLTVSAGYKTDGTRIYIRKTITAKSEREAKKQLALFEAEVQQKNITADSNIKLKDFVRICEDNYAKVNLEAKTYQRYMEMINSNIIPELGEKKLNEIKPVHLLDFYSKLGRDGARKDGKKGGYSNKTITHIHRIISEIYNKAEQWQIIGINPAANVKPPKIMKKEIDFYSVEDIKILIKSLEDEPIRARTMTLLAVYTGMRRSELLGLTWDSIDFEAKVIHINKAVVYIPKIGRLKKETKTVRSNRMIAMSESVENLLVQYRKWQCDTKDMLANKWTDSDFVFTNDFGEMIHPDSISQWFNRFIKRKGLKHITFHGLRHTAATLLISSGVDIETVSRILGHSSSAVTSQVYLHSADAIRKDAMNRLDRTINGR